MEDPGMGLPLLSLVWRGHHVGRSDCGRVDGVQLARCAGGDRKSVYRGQAEAHADRVWDGRARVGPWTGVDTLDVSHALLDRRDSGSSVSAGCVTNVALLLGLRRRLGHGAAAHLGIGGLIYFASEAGAFNHGSGGPMPLVSLSGAYSPPIAASHGLELSAQYDLHRFITPALRSVGFNRARPVHRLAIALSARVLGR